MSCSALPHVVGFLTRPLLATFPSGAISLAQLILSASLPPNATFTLTSTTTPPPALYVASIRSGISWAAWFNALGGGRDVLLVYGSGYLKVRVGDAPVRDVWREECMSRVVPTIHIEREPNPVIPLFHQATRARLRSALISASLRNMRRPQHQRSASSESASSDDSGCTYASSSDSDSDDTASTSPSSATACFSSSRTSVANSASKAAQLLSTHDAPIYVALPPRSSHTTACAWRSTRRVPLLIDEDKTHTPVAYVYGSGLTRIMTGGVMLGPRPAAHVVASTRS